MKHHATHQAILTILLSSAFLCAAMSGVRAQSSSSPLDPARSRIAVPRPPVMDPSLDCGDTNKGYITRPDAKARFFFEGEAGETVDLAMNEVGGFSDSFPIATVKAPGNEELATLIGTELETLVLPVTGRYKVRVTAATPGIFTLGLGCLGIGGTPLTCGVLDSGDIDAPGDLDYFTFDAFVDELVQISLAATAGFDGSTARGTLFSPTGVILGTVDADNVKLFTLPESGTWVLRVQANDLEGSGTYNVGLGCLPPPGAILLTCGAPPENASAGPGELTYFTFDGGVDDVVEVVITGDGSHDSVPQARVFTPLGVQIATFTSDSIQPLSLPEAGRYTIEVRAADLGDAGDFTISVACRDPLGPSIALDCGDVVSGTLTVDEVDYYTVDGLAGDVAEITLVATGGFPGISSAQFRVFTPSGVDLGLFTADSVNPITLPETGEHKIRVNANTLIDTGTYDIGLVCLPPSGISHIGDDSLLPADIVAMAEIDYYSFDGQLDEVVELSLVVTSGFGGTTLRGTLFSPSSSNLGTIDANDLKGFALPEDGVYEVRIAPTNGTSTGTYNFGLERRQAPNGLADLDPQSPPLVCGQLIATRIGRAGEVDYFRFGGSLDDQIQITLAQSGFPSGAFARATLFSPTGVNLGTQNANGITTYTLPEDGVYAVRVFANNHVSTGDYSLGLECIVPLGPVDAHLACGDLVADSISARGEVDYFSFDGTVDDQIQLTLARSGYPSGAYARATLFSPTGVALGTLDSNGIGAYTLPETGRYAVRVWTNNFVSTGSYSLGLECIVPLGPVESHLECGDLVADSISARGEVDYYSFDGAVDDQVQLTLARSGFPSGAYARATVFSPTGAWVGTWDSNGIGAYTLPETGRYAVRVWTNNLVSTGNYSIGFERIVPLCTVDAHLKCGDLVADSIGARGEVDYYSFDGAVDDQVQLTLVRSGFPSGAYARATVFSPTGAWVGAWDSNGIGAYTLPETGTYAVRVWANNFVSTGNYSIGLECVVPLGPVEAHLECGDLVADSISARGEVDYFSFDGAVDDQVQLILAGTSFPSGTYARATLFAPSGANLGTQNGNGFEAFTLTESGTYAVRVWTNNYVSVGNYSIGLDRIVPLCTVDAQLECGDLVADSISVRGEVDYFSFEGAVDDQVQLILAGTSFPSGTYARATLFAPSGANLGTQDGNGFEAFALTESGTYAVRVWTNNYVSVGNYSIGLDRIVPLCTVDAQLDCGDLVADSISVRGEVDYFSFDGAVDDQIQLVLAGTSFPSGTYARATLFSPTGANLGTREGNGFALFTLTESGTYAVRVWTNNYVSTGNYSIGLDRIVPLCTVDAHLDCGDLVADSISVRGEVDYFSFDGTDGQMIDLSLSQSGFPSGTYARATVFAPSGASLGTCNANGICSYTLTETGTYAVRVWTNNYVSTGDYNIGLGCP